MIDERWDDLVDAIEARFEILDRGKSQRQDRDSGEPKADVEYIVFERGGEKLKLERYSRFAVIDERVIYHRHAAGSQIERKYSDSEKTHRVQLYRWDSRDDSWEEMNLDEMFR